MSVRLNEDEAWSVIEGSHTGIITTLRADGSPVTLPMWFVVIDRTVCFFTFAHTKKVARIKAKTDATVAVEGARRRTALVNAALEGKLDAALSLLKLQVIDAQVLAGRRLSDDMLRELLPQPRAPHQGDSALAVIQPAETPTGAVTRSAPRSRRR